MIKYQPLAQAKQRPSKAETARSALRRPLEIAEPTWVDCSRLREDATDAEAQKVYDEHFPLYKPHGRELHQ